MTEPDWKTADLDDVIRHYVSGFTPSEGTKIVRTDFYIDNQKRKVVFQMLVEAAPDSTGKVW